MAARDIGHIGEGRVLMGLLVVVVGGIPGKTMPEQAQTKQPEHHQTETLSRRRLRIVASPVGCPRRVAVVVPGCTYTTPAISDAYPGTRSAPGGARGPCPLPDVDKGRGLGGHNTSYQVQGKRATT